MIGKHKGIYYYFVIFLLYFFGFDELGQRLLSRVKNVV